MGALEEPCVSGWGAGGRIPWARPRISQARAVMAQRAEENPALPFSTHGQVLDSAAAAMGAGQGTFLWARCLPVQPDVGHKGSPMPQGSSLGLA